MLYAKKVYFNIFNKENLKFKGIKPRVYAYISMLVYTFNFVLPPPNFHFGNKKSIIT